MARFSLVAIDLDGTLLDSSRRISPRDREALWRAHGMGVRIAVVTGRRLPAAALSVRSLGFQPLMVVNSGSLIKEGLTGEILRRRLLNVDVARRVIRAGHEIDMKAVVHDGPDGEGRLIIEQAPSESEALAFYLNQAVPAPVQVPRLPEALERDPVQVMFADTVDRVRELELLLARLFRERMSLARTEYAERDVALLDALSPEATKGKALCFLAERYRIPRERVMAIGDNWNDLDMLEAAGLAVVMANAAPELKSRGFVSTASNDEAGVARALERYLFTGFHSDT